MTRLITVPGCKACKKAAASFKNREIPYTQENLFLILLDDHKIKALIESLQEEFPDYYNKLKELAGSQKLETFLTHNPSLISRPLIFDGENQKTDYDPLQPAGGCNESCSIYSVCQKARDLYLR